MNVAEPTYETSAPRQTSHGASIDLRRLRRGTSRARIMRRAARQWRQVLWLPVAFGALILVAGCGAEDSAVQSEMAPVQEVVTAAPDRELTRSADMSLRVGDVRETVDRIESITSQTGGRIADESVTSTGDALYATVTARVPAGQLDAVITAVGNLGEVMSLSVVTEDVTAQGADLDARIEALQVSIARLRQLLASAQTTKDLIEIEAALTQRQADLDSLVAQRAALSDLVALSTLSVTVNPSSESAVWTPPGFVAGLASGWNALRAVTAGLVTFLGFLLPFIAVLAILAVPVALLVILLRRRR